MLFEKYNKDIKIIKEVVKTVVGNRSNGETIIQLFFKKCGEDIKIIEEVVKVVTGNIKLNEETIIRVFF